MHKSAGGDLNFLIPNDARFMRAKNEELLIRKLLQMLQLSIHNTMQPHVFWGVR
jgi:hypothetical protein